MMPFDHLAAKHGMTAAQGSAPAVCPCSDAALDRLDELLSRFRAVAKVGRLKPGKYTDGGIGLFFSPRWKDEEAKQEIHDLFWSEVGVSYLDRHGETLPSFRDPINDLESDPWERFK
ncbi:MAG: hypothetical protein AB7E51_06855 [Pseudodesulfovibrio sp.]|uniref:hypothetical protein n=1 Tax=Pseudodesulfovibrio sp. TaxID=2035812 RepID=UPI003D0CAF77